MGTEKVDYEFIRRRVPSLIRSERITPASQDKIRIGLLGIDDQNTFCLKTGADLPVPGAWEDNGRLSEFILDNLSRLTAIEISLDTHTSMQIFFPIFWVDFHSNHPMPFAKITHEDVVKGIWRINPEVGKVFGKSEEWLAAYALHYTRVLGELTIWSYHAQIGSVGHALDCRIEEAIFYHSLARQTNPFITLKGMDPFTECYSAIGPEVLTDHNGARVGAVNVGLRDRLLDYDVLIVAGQAKSHCVLKTVEDILEEISNTKALESGLARHHFKVPKVYFLEDCSSLIPGFEQEVEEAFKGFVKQNLHIVKSTTPMKEWPDIELE